MLFPISLCFICNDATPIDLSAVRRSLLCARVSPRKPRNCQRLLTSSSIRRPVADLQLSETIGAECDILADSYDALTIRVFSGFEGGCYSLNDVLSPGEREQNFTCNPNACGNDFLALLPADSSQPTHYTRAYYSVYQPTSPESERKFDLSLVTIRTYAGDECQDQPDMPWFSWGNCNETDRDCTELPYRVGSFHILETSDANASDSCLIAVERGAGVKWELKSVVTTLVSAVLVGIYISF